MRSSLFILLLGISCVFAAEKNSFEGIEYFIERPADVGVFPAVVMIHGYQPEKDSIGGQECLKWPIVKSLLEEKIITVAISIPGFGGSEGKRDYCGPIAQKAVIALIDHLKTLPFIDSNRIGLLGVSRGASTAAMISSRYDGLAFQILIAGKYDYTEPFSSLFKGIQKQYVNEGEENWLDRSALFHADTTHIPTLILHGKLDPVHPFSTAQKYHDALLSTGVVSRLAAFSHLSHFLVRTTDVLPELISFIRERVFNKSGIGIRLSPMQGYPQIAEFISGFPAEKSNLRLGDMLLGVSSNNDETFIKTYRMSMDEVSKLIVGEKSTELRLKVVHLDGTEEEIEIERMKF